MQDLNMAGNIQGNKKSIFNLSQILVVLLSFDHLCNANSSTWDLLRPSKDNRTTDKNQNFVLDNNKCHLRDDIDCVLNEFTINFPFLERDLGTLNKTLRSIDLIEGIYVGQLKPFLQGSVSGGKIENQLGFDQNNENTIVEKVVKLANKPIRHGWGKMSWENGTLYGRDLQFIYLEGDEYLGHWSNDLQSGNCETSVSIVLILFILLLILSDLILQTS